MMNGPLVSVVIPCFIHAHFLAGSIDSVIAQSWTSVETIVVDDGSTDHTLQVAGSYPEVRVVSQVNGGLAAAWNTGLELSKGEYLVFLDADDRLLPTALLAGVSSLALNPEAAFVWGGYRLLDGDKMSGVNGDDINDGLSTFENMLRGNFIAMHATVMYRRPFVTALGGFNTSLKACEDYDLYLRIARIHPIARHSAVVAEYNRHDSNMSYDSALMLESALAVLSSQQPLTVANEQHERSRLVGIEHWKQFYGLRAPRRFFRQLVCGQVSKACSDFKRVLAAVGSMHLFLHLPVWIVTHLYEKLNDAMSSRRV